MPLPEAVDVQELQTAISCNDAFLFNIGQAQFRQCVSGLWHSSYSCLHRPGDHTGTSVAQAELIGTLLCKVLIVLVTLESCQITVQECGCPLFLCPLPTYSMVWTKQP